MFITALHFIFIFLSTGDSEIDNAPIDGQTEIKYINRKVVEQNRLSSACGMEDDYHEQSEQ